MAINTWMRQRLANVVLDSNSIYCKSLLIIFMILLKKLWIQSEICFFFSQVWISYWISNILCLFSKCYRVAKKAQKVSYELRNQLRSPLETGVWYVEHTIATKGFELGRANTVDMCWFTYYSLDAISVILLSVLSAIYIVKFLITQLLTCCCAGSSNTGDSIKKIN